MSMSSSIFSIFLVCSEEFKLLLEILSLRSWFSIANLFIRVRKDELSSVLKLCAKITTSVVLISNMKDVERRIMITVLCILTKCRLEIIQLNYYYYWIYSIMGKKEGSKEVGDCNLLLVFKKLYPIISSICNIYCSALFIHTNSFRVT